MGFKIQLSMFTGTVFMASIEKSVVKYLKKKEEHKNEPEIVVEKLETEFPLSGGETDEDLEKALKKKEDDKKRR